MTTTGTDKSTIVRLWSATGVSVMRAGFRILEHVSPTLGSRWALRVWLTPPRRRPVRRTNAPAAPAAPAGQRFLADGRVVAESWGNGPPVYLLHGWGGSRAQFTSFVAPLVAAGLRPVALDAPGHGESGPGAHGGRRSTLTEIAEALAAVAAVTGPAHTVISHSAGCASATIAVRDGLAAERLVFLAPMADPMPYLATFAGALGIGERTRRLFLDRLEGAARRSLADFDLPAQATAGPLPPLLVVHDRGDRESPHSDGQAVAEAWPGARLHSTSGLGHRRLLSDPEVISSVVDYVTADHA